MKNDRFDYLRASHEVLDLIVDDWCDREKAERERAGIRTTKLDLKRELGQAIGLGNGGNADAALKGLYRYLSGETPLSLEKALQICHYIHDYQLIQWVGFRAGMLMTPRAAVNDFTSIESENVLDEILKCLREASVFVETLSSGYQAKPSSQAILKIEDAFLRVTLQEERCRLLLRGLIENAMRPRSADAAK